MNSEIKSAASGGPLITVSVVSHGNGDALQLLLESLRRYEQAELIQLVVTDNLGTDLPAVPRGQWHSLIMIRNDQPQGYGRNHNAAFERSEGKYFCVVNPDACFIEPILRALSQLLQAGGGHIVAPLIVDSRDRIQDSFRGLPAPLELIWRRTVSTGHTLSAPPGEAVHPDWIAGILLLMRRESFAKLGGFDERYHLYFEDVDLCTRARLMGLTLTVATGLRLRHDASRASSRRSLYLLWHLQSAYRFFSSEVYRQARRLKNTPAEGRR